MSAKSLYESRVESLLVSVYATNQEMGTAAAQEARAVIQSAIRTKGTANFENSLR